MRTLQAGSERVVARVDHGDDNGPLIQTSISGVLLPATRAEIRRTFWRYPLFTFAVMLRIHWHALLLWLKRVPFFSKPEPPSELVPLDIVLVSWLPALVPSELLHFSLSCYVVVSCERFLPVW